MTDGCPKRRASAPAAKENSEMMARANNMAEIC